MYSKKDMSIYKISSHSFQEWFLEVFGIFETVKIL